MEDLWWRPWWGEWVLDCAGGMAEWALRDWFFLNEVLKTLGLASLKPKCPAVLPLRLQRIGTWSLLAADATRRGDT